MIASRQRLASVDTQMDLAPTAHVQIGQVCRDLHIVPAGPCPPNSRRGSAIVVRAGAALKKVGAWACHTHQTVPVLPTRHLTIVRNVPLNIRRQSFTELMNGWQTFDHNPAPGWEIVRGTEVESEDVAGTENPSRLR